MPMGLVARRLACGLLLCLMVRPTLAAADGQPIQPVFAGAAELSLEQLEQEVLARNPSLAQMVAAWEAASARLPQVTSLEDPMLGTMFAPASVNSRNVEPGWRVEVSQKYPFPGKLRLRGQTAQAEASAAGHDVADMRLQLIESARNAFYDYFLVERSLDVNKESLDLLRKFRDDARKRFENRLAELQDVLQADVEIARQQEKLLTLERMRKVATARLNTLMHLPPDAPLPPPPKAISVLEALPEAQELRDLALARRPDLQAVTERIRAEQAALALACKEAGPDIEVMGAYDTMMGNGPMRDLAAQVGVRVNLPIRAARRHGAIAEAQARLAQRKAEYDRQVDQINFQVQEACAQVEESLKIVRLYEGTIRKAAQANVEAAQSAYVNGKIPFLSLMEAQRNQAILRDRGYEAVTDYFRRRASLERVIGGAVR